MKEGAIVRSVSDRDRIGVVICCDNDVVTVSWHDGVEIVLVSEVVPA
jgi:hypothetical protein